MSIWRLLKRGAFQEEQPLPSVWNVLFYKILHQCCVFVSCLTWKQSKTVWVMESLLLRWRIVYAVLRQHERLFCQMVESIEVGLNLKKIVRVSLSCISVKCKDKIHLKNNYIHVRDYKKYTRHTCKYKHIELQLWERKFYLVSCSVTLLPWTSTCTVLVRFLITALPLVVLLIAVTLLSVVTLLLLVTWLSLVTLLLLVPLLLFVKSLEVFDTVKLSHVWYWTKQT